MDPKQQPEAKQPEAKAEVKADEAETEPLRPTPITDPNNVIYTDENGVQHKVCLPPPGTRLRTAAPNEMTYTDDKGVRHSIYLPQGTMHAACDHLENERWDELAKFEPYSEYTPSRFLNHFPLDERVLMYLSKADQGYTDEDFKKWEETHKEDEEEGQVEKK
ncbi:hypothetical protein B0T09DRAFT_147543 [Sordaria sp. MPI-SDFR-AT-0083]|nr:hypothetical protein B0T09DRAFT_147543 [Sordaria sp. MPI-SDFR-AT-0083]